MQLKYLLKTREDLDQIFHLANISAPQFFAAVAVPCVACASTATPKIVKQPTQHARRCLSPTAPVCAASTARAHACLQSHSQRPSASQLLQQRQTQRQTSPQPPPRVTPPPPPRPPLLLQHDALEQRAPLWYQLYLECDALAFLLWLLQCWRL